MNTAIARQRLLNQRITGAKRAQPADVVTWLGAVQAQEYPAAKWALALRMGEGTTDARIDRAFDEGRILRTHVMRPTWHFVTPVDIRWMLELTAPHVHRTMTTYNRRLELDSATLTRAIRVFERALRDGQFLTRTELGISLQRDGIEAKGQRLAHLTMHAELEAVICSGPRRGKQFTYALLAERAPSARGLPRDEALAELSRRYFTSHGPAIARDFAWWSGLPAADSRRGLELIRARPQIVEGRKYWTTGRAPAPVARPGLVHLLPIYDEYLVAYQDREAVPHTYSSIVSEPGRFVTFQHALVIRGQVAGTWRTARTASGMALNVFPTKQLTGSERRELANIASRFEQFLEAPVSLSIH